MKIGVCILILNQQEMTQKFFNLLRENELEKLPYCIIDNGSKPPVRSWLMGLQERDDVIRNPKNVGVMPGLNQGFQYFKNAVDYIFYIHNDVMLYERGWDAKLMRILTTVDNVGCAGFYGAKSYAQPDIYKAPYQMHQLARGETVSNCHRMNANVHGFRPVINGRETEQVAVLDGFSLIVSTELLKKTGGFDRAYPIHHQYDNDICLESLDRGYNNIVIAMDADHIGGQTDVKEDWASPFGKTKQQVHIDAHPITYEKWSPKNVENGLHKISLPIRITTI